MTEKQNKDAVPSDIGLRMGTRRLKKLEEMREVNQDEKISLEMSAWLNQAFSKKIDEEIEKEKKSLNTYSA